ncbi:hypothetical protein SAMN05421833_12986 [Microbispora rosea]|uniref:Uncharacterized protein n=1 Tax=Microbispora rosea TaxID=58117 RepID=A0A1N7GIY0_9ACTN|nr:hypothetical protein [Microbispora rosea]SIS12565.1 hypothetical protein SAMN05421833_12986 [Microbispora rosea]
MPSLDQRRANPGKAGRPATRREQAEAIAALAAERGLDIEVYPDEGADSGREMREAIARGDLEPMGDASGP